MNNVDILKWNFELITVICYFYRSLENLSEFINPN